jgi:hypothetical protein
MLFNRFLLVRFKDAKKVIGGRQTYIDGRLLIPPTISFECSHTNESTPNEATIKIHNVAPETQRELFVTGKRVEIEAGYWPQNGAQETAIIFKGQIRSARSYVENGVDNISELTFGDSDDAARSRRARIKLPAGTSHGQVVSAMIAEMGKDGVTRGTIDVPNYSEVRPMTIDRPAWRELEDIAHQHNLLWSVQDGKLNMYPADRPLLDKAVTLTPTTGVLDTPEFTDTGVDIRTMMIPYLRPGHTFILRNDLAVNRAPEKFRIEEINFSGSNYGDEFGASISAKVMGTSGKVKRSRDRQAGRRA